jgi:molybdopterin/thiamine biosynthesis adenylyltransferase
VPRVPYVVNAPDCASPTSPDPRYARQTLLPGIGPEGQARLSRAHVIVVGCGALGCVSADLLARAGVGRITLVDRDIVEATNLQRQTLYTEADADAGTPKAEAAAIRLRSVNSAVEIRPIAKDVNAETAPGIIGDHRGTVLVDGTDNFETRFLLNDVAVQRDLAYVYGGAVGTRGMAWTVLPASNRESEELPCVRCLFRDPPAPGSQPTCDTAGVLNAVTAMVGAYQACEAIKLCVGRVDLVARSLLDFDPWEGRRRRMDLSGARAKDCPCCVDRRFEFASGERGTGTTALCGRDAVQVSPRTPGWVDLTALADRVAAAGEVRAGAFTLELTTPEVRLTVFRDGRALVHGVSDPTRARSIYDRLIGA